MMFELEKKAKELGYKKIILDTSDKQVVAQKLYEKYGYVETKREQTPKFVMMYYEKQI